MFTFYLKKTAAAFISPLGLVILLMVTALLMSLGKRKKLAIFFNMSALLVLLMVTTPFLPNTMLPQLERQYPQFDIGQQVDAIVVLGCGHRNDPELSITSQVHSCSLYRITEGIRLWRQNQSAMLLFSGYGANEPFSNAETAAELAQSLGVPKSKILVNAAPKNTQEEANLLASELTGKSFALVTSASHMPRALAYFRKVGLQPIAAPTGHLLKDESRDSWWQQAPNSGHLHKTERLVYEYLALFWQQINE